MPSSSRRVNQSVSHLAAQPTNSRVIQLKQTKRIRNCATVNAAEQMPMPILTLAAPTPLPPPSPYLVLRRQRTCVAHLPCWFDKLVMELAAGNTNSNSNNNNRQIKGATFAGAVQWQMPDGKEAISKLIRKTCKTLKRNGKTESEPGR